MTMFLSAAITSAADPLRIRLASSLSVPSRTPCRPFSMPQWARINSSKRRGPACWRARLVTPKTTSISVFVPMRRSRVSRKTCAQPDQSDCRYSARADVTSMVRFSTRPCPLVVSEACSISDSRRATRRGGKAGFRLGKDGLDIGPQRRLIVLDWQDVVASFFNDLGTSIAMCEHRITCNDLALNRQHSQQFQRRLVFIRLGVDPELSHGGVDVGSIGGYQVGCGRVLIPTSPGSLTVNGKVKGLA